MSIARRLVGLGLLALAACGGGGGGGGGSPTTLSGSFRFGQVAGFDQPATFRTSTGVAVADANGDIVLTATENVDGVISANALTLIQSTLDSNGSLALAFGGGFPSARGVVGADGDLALVAATSDDLPPTFMTFVREWPSPATNADFAGAFHYGIVGRATGVQTVVGQATSDGAGKAELAAGAASNNGGALSAALEGSFTFAVAANGATTMTLEGDIQLAGGLLPGGGLLITSGSITDGDDPAMFAFVQAATTATNATLSGTYRIVGIAHAFDTPAFRSMTGTLVADGAGNATIQWTTSQVGAIVIEPAFAATYGVGSSGILGVTTPTVVLQGAVSQDGRYGFLSGGTTFGSEPTFLLLVRQ
jgi:hypothetical protein